MFLVYLIKNICLMSFCFAFTTTVFTSIIHRPMLVVYFITLGCFSLTYYIQHNKKYLKFKYLAMFGLVLIAIYLRNIIGIIASIPPFIYILFIIKKDDFKVDYKEFKALFMGLIVAILFLPIFVYIVGDFEMFKSISLPYAVVFVVSGYYLLRTVRHSEKVINSRKFVIMNLIVIAVSFIICIILGSEAFVKSLILTLNFIYRSVYPLVIRVLYVLFNPLAKILNKAREEASLEENLIELEEELPEIEEMPEDASQPLFLLYTLAIGMFIFIIIAIVARVLSKRKRVKDKDAEIYGIKQYRSSLDDDFSVNKKAKQTLNGSVEQIRYWYTKFLTLCFRKNMDIFISDNSKTICEKSSKIFINSEQELVDIREIYRKARYSNQDTNKRDIKAIKSIFKNLEKKKYKKI